MAKSELQKKNVKQIIKVKKKKWLLIVSPKFMGEVPLGESYLEEGNLAVGREIQVNLMQITGDVKSQNSDVKFEITGASDNKLDTRVIGYSFSSSSIKRFMRRHMTRIDDSLVVMTKDNIKIRIKPFLLTRSKVTKAVEHGLRVILREELINMVHKTPYEQLFSMVIKYQLQKEVKDKLNKIYPVKNLEIRILKEEKYHSAKETEMPIKKISKKVNAKKEQAEEIDEERKETSEQPQQEENEEPVVEEKPEQ